MKLNKLSSAIGAACVAMTATSAFALPASSWGPSGATSANIYISGASAQDNGILAFALQECTNGSVHRYAISNNFVYFCTPGATLNVNSTQVAIHKFSVGGSGNGVGPVRLGSSLPFLNLAAIATSCAAVASNITTAATFGTLTQTYVNTVCGASSAVLATNSQVTKLGLSDLEPAFFDAATSPVMTSEPVATLLFGVPVSRNIYKALQTQQGLNTGNCTNTASSTAAPTWEYSNECMPSLSRAQIVSAYTQSGQTWAGIGVTSGLADDAIYVARRVNSSGTQKTFEALIARTPNGVNTLKSCIAGNEVFQDPTSGDTTVGDAFATICGTTPNPVFAGSGGGDVRSCMITHNANSRGAIGILTAEDIARSTDNWRFVKVGGGTATNRGAAPTHADVASGNYQFWTVPTLNYLPATATTAPYGSVSPATNFIARLKFELADPVGLAIQQPFGASGLMALWALQTGAPALDFVGTSGVNPWGRLVAGTTLDNCQTGKAANF
jgi:ABC-type phosphate transport system substrate-binding protein